MSSPSQLSFLPDDYLDRKMQRRSNVVCAGLFVIVMCVIGAAFTLTDGSIREIERRHRDVDKQYTEAAMRIEQVRALQDKQREMAQQAELTASLLEKVPRTFVLAEITNALPANVSLIDFTLEARVKNAPAAMPKAKTIFEQKQQEIAKENAAKKLAEETRLQPRSYDVSMKLSGVADSDVQVAKFISKLNGSPLFKDVNLVVSDQFNRDGQTLRKFQLELTLVPDADVSQLKPVTRTAAVELEGK